jgi:hypothetical protein
MSDDYMDSSASAMQSEVIRQNIEAAMRRSKQTCPDCGGNCDELLDAMRASRQPKGEIIPDLAPTPTIDKAIALSAIELPKTKAYFVVELNTDFSDETRIEVENGRNFAVGALEGDGVIRLIDLSYRSPEEARAAWPEIDGKTTIQGGQQVQS